ncbi:MAG: exodeoxyribonuclease III, partial [Solirubrobacterales bacterium]
ALLAEDPYALAGVVEYEAVAVFAPGAVAEGLEGLQGFTWWDYRGGSFHRGMGLRIDLLLASEPLAGEIKACGIDRDFRKGPKPSDHAPLIVELS